VSGHSRRTDQGSVRLITQSLSDHSLNVWRAVHWLFTCKPIHWRDGKHETSLAAQAFSAPTPCQYNLSFYSTNYY